MAYEDRMMSSFRETLSKIAVSEEEALDSARIISEDKRSRVRRYADSGLVGGTLSPMVEAAGRFARDAGNAKGNRFRAGKAAVKAMTRGEVAQSVTKGVLGGAAVRAGQEGLQARRAHETYKRFMNQETPGVG